MKKLARLRKQEYIIILVFILISVLIRVFSLSQIKEDSMKATETNLVTINTSCREALKQWLNFRENNIRELAGNEYLVNKTIELLELEQSQEALISSPLTKELREFFQPVLSANEDLGVFLIAPDYMSIFSMRDENTGSLNLMAEQRKELLDKVLFDGEIVLIPPIQSDVVLESKYAHETAHTMFLVAPVIYQDKIIAAFSLRLDTHKDFSRILELGLIGETGETYGFDKYGKMVTNSRFEAQIKELGMLKSNEESITNVDIAGSVRGNLTSGNNLTLIEMTDCRGEKAFCVSSWDEELNIGIVSKIDKKEALKEYFYVRKMLMYTFFILLVIGLVVISVIINLRQKAENILIKTNETLEIQVAERTKELQETIRVKDKFFSILAHDLRSPFNGLLGLFDLLLHDPESLSEEEKNDLIHQVYNSGTQLFRLLENLLSWSRTQTDTIKLNPEKIPVREFIDENILLQKEQAGSKKIELISENIQDINIYADRNTINTVLRNLISNAIKFTKEGGIVKVETTVNNKMLDIIVRDNGVGIPEETLHKLFKIDEKITTRGTNNEGGTGLGLALCKEFAALNKGKISVESTVGLGSSFTLSLPMSE